jgi:endonuclease YncB( thermonuclease family)
VTAFWILAGLGLAAPWLLGEFSWLRLAPAYACRLQAISDGDTLRATCRGETVRIRLHCLDAPELDQPPWGQQRRDQLRRMVPRTFRLVEHERYGQIIGKVVEEETSLDQAMVASGCAAVYLQYCGAPRC